MGDRQRHAVRVLLAPVLLVVLLGLVITWLAVFVFDPSYRHYAMLRVVKSRLSWAERFQHSIWSNYD